MNDFPGVTIVAFLTALLGIVMPKSGGGWTDIVRPFGVAASCKCNACDARRGSMWVSREGPTMVAIGDGTFAANRTPAAKAAKITGDFPVEIIESPIATEDEQATKNEATVTTTESAPTVEYSAGQFQDSPPVGYGSMGSQVVTRAIPASSRVAGPILGSQGGVTRVRMAKVIHAGTVRNRQVWGTRVNRSRRTARACWGR